MVKELNKSKEKIEIIREERIGGTLFTGLIKPTINLLEDLLTKHGDKAIIKIKPTFDYDLGYAIQTNSIETDEDYEARPEEIKLDEALVKQHKQVTIDQLKKSIKFKKSELDKLEEKLEVLNA